MCPPGERAVRRALEGLLPSLAATECDWADVLRRAGMSAAAGRCSGWGTRPLQRSGLGGPEHGWGTRPL